MTINAGYYYFYYYNYFVFQSAVVCEVSKLFICIDEPLLIPHYRVPVSFPSNFIKWCEVMAVRAEWLRLTFLTDLSGILEERQDNLRLRITPDESIVFDPVPD